MAGDGVAFDLAECLELARRQNPQAAGRLVREMYPLVAKIVRAYVPEANLQEEWEQEVFLRLFARLHQYRAAAEFEHWLARIAVNVCIDALRARRRRSELRWSDLSEPEAEIVRAAAGAAGTSVPDALAARELAYKMLDTLPADDRVIVQMLDMESRSVAEVAELTGRTRTGVKVRALRARRKLRALFETFYHDQRPAADGQDSGDAKR
jgi:RNA polymerase sigma-70 factor (ECF subfamily)